MTDAKEEKKLIKTLTFGLGNPLAWNPKAKELVILSDEQRKSVYAGLRATSRVLAQLVNMLNAREYVRRIMVVPDELVDQFKGNYTPIKRELEALGIAEVEDISGATLSQTYALGVKPDFAGEHGKSLLMKGDRQLSTHRTDGTHPIYGRGKETQIVERDNRYFLAVQLFSLVWAEKNQMPSGWIAFPVVIKPRDKTLASQIKRAMEGEWQLKNSRIMRNPKKRGDRVWLGQIVASYTPEPFKKTDPDTVMGIDLGVSVPACLHIRSNGDPKPWAMLVGHGLDMLRVRRVIKGEIVRIVRALRSKDSPLDGPARKAATVKLRTLRKRERRVMKTASQKIAAMIAETARRHGAGVWQMEELSENIKDDSPWLRQNWAPGMVVDAVRWQAVQAGAELRFVDPRYTSQRCSKCGHIAPENRPKGKAGASAFQCVECGYKDHADKNAARNLSTVGIADTISSQLEKAPNGAER